MKRLIAFLLLITIAPCAYPAGNSPADFDYIIKNGRIFDGMGNAWYRADIGITGDKIEKSGLLLKSAGKQ